jgi:hypothetical protein
MMDDTISRRAAIDVFEPWLNVGGYSEGELNMLKDVLYELRCLPSARPDNRLEKIADIVEGTIDHLDRDDAMDMLYQIKEVLKK